MFHFRTNLQTRNITPRASAERGQENGAPTSLHSLHKVLTTCAANQKHGSSRSAPKNPLFLLHRAPAAVAAFRSATARRAALSAEMRSSFSPRTEKKKRGVQFNKRDRGASPTKERYSKREETPIPKGPLAQRAELPRQTRRPHPGQAPLPEGATSCPHSGANPLGIPSVRGIRPTRGIAPKSDHHISAFSRTGSTM